MTPALRRCNRLAIALFALTPPLSQLWSQTGAKDGPESVNSSSVLTLSPFVIDTKQDRGYASTNTLSGTRTNEELRNLPNAISILNAQFLEDVAVNDFFQAMPYLVNMEAAEGGAAGVGGNSGVQVNVRGIPNSWQSRNGFQWYVPVDTFNTERLEANLGASGQLYGDIGAGGILNVSTKAASFSNRSSLQLRVSDWGQRRATIDANRQITDRWATRVNAVSSRGGDWRDGPHSDFVGAALANTLTLGRRAKLRLEGEWGEVNNRVGHSLLVDGYSDYAVTTPGTIASDVDPATPGVQAQYTITAPNALGVPASYPTTGTIQTAGNAQAWRIIRGQLVSLESTASNVYRQTQRDTNRSANVSETLIPREQQWAGPDNTADRDYHTVTALLTSQLHPDLWVELAYNLQDQRNTTWQSGVGQVRYDPNPVLPAPGGLSGSATVPNPEFNQLYVEHTWDGSVVTNVVHNWRALAAYDWKPFGWMTQRVVGMAALRDEAFTSTGVIENLNTDRIAALGLTGGAAQFGNNRVVRRFYLRDGNADSTLARGALPYVENRAVASAFNARQWQSLTTGSLNAFGSYWKGRVRTSLGIRRDLWQKDIDPVVADPATGLATFPTGRIFNQRLWNSALNYGGVLNLTPWLAAVANYSETFIANSSGFLFDGTDIQPQQGDGTDFGLRLSLLDDRVSARATYFTANARNSFVAGIVSGNTTNSQTVLYEIINVLGPTNAATGRAFTGGGANGRDSQDRESVGFEFELTANPTPSWTLRGALTILESKNVSRARQLRSVFDRMVRAADAGGVGQLSGQPLNAASYANTAARLSELDDEDPRQVWRPNVSTRYAFSGGSLRGGFVGGSLLWNDEQKVNAVFTQPTATSPVPTLLRQGYKIDSYLIANVFVGYSRRIGRLQWRGQLNVDNLFNEDIRLGGYATARFPNPRQLILTNTFIF